MVSEKQLRKELAILRRKQEREETEKKLKGEIRAIKFRKFTKAGKVIGRGFKTSARALGKSFKAVRRVGDAEVSDFKRRTGRVTTKPERSKELKGLLKKFKAQQRSKPRRKETDISRLLIALGQKKKKRRSTDSFKRFAEKELKKKKKRVPIQRRESFIEFAKRL